MTELDRSDSIERLLREDARRETADDGFSARVVARLPEPAAGQRPWFKPVLVIGSTLLGSVLATALAPGGLPLAEGIADLTLLRGLTPAALTGLALCGAMVISAIVLAVETE